MSDRTREENERGHSMVSLCDRGVGWRVRESPHSGKCLFFVPTYINYTMTVFLFTVMLVLFILPNILFAAQCWETQQRKVKPRHWSRDRGDLKASKRTLQKQIAQLLLQSLRKLLEWVISNGNPLTKKLYPFFICNVYSSVNRLHREKPTVVWSNFCFYNVQYCTVSVEKGKLTWILCYVSCFVIMECNCTIWPLYFKNTLFFTSIYLYVCMFVQKRKTNVYFFIFVTACLNIT